MCFDHHLTTTAIDFNIFFLLQITPKNQYPKKSRCPHFLPNHLFCAFILFLSL